MKLTPFGKKGCSFSTSVPTNPTANNNPFKPTRPYTDQSDFDEQPETSVRSWQRVYVY